MFLHLDLNFFYLLRDIHSYIYSDIHIYNLSVNDIARTTNSSYRWQFICLSEQQRNSHRKREKNSCHIRRSPYDEGKLFFSCSLSNSKKKRSLISNQQQLVFSIFHTYRKATIKFFADFFFPSYSHIFPPLQVHFEGLLFSMST